MRCTQHSLAATLFVMLETTRQFHWTTLLLSTAALLGFQPVVAQNLLSDPGRRGGNAAAGVAIYQQSCATCHGQRLEGSPFGTPLVGQAFLERWADRSAAELLTQMRNTMPPRGAPPVKPEAFPDLLALVLGANSGGPEYLASLSTLMPAATPSPGRSAPAAPPTGSTLPSSRDARRLDALGPVTEAMLASPPEGDWLMWRRTPDAQGFSPLRQVNRNNVQRLRKAWSVTLDPSANEIAPLAHEGVLFVYSGNALEAIDGATGSKLWRYQRSDATRRGFAGAQNSRVRSIALFGHALFMPTADGHVLAVDMRSGRLLWDRAVTGSIGNGAVMFSSGPLFARGLVILGASLGLTSKGGNFIVALDAATGEERWRFHTVARPGGPGGDSWNDAPVEERFGAGVWTTGSYDPELDLVYFGVGNTYTTATLLEPRAGASAVTGNDGLFTNATLALRPATGELVWHYQHHKRDVWDQDWAFEQTLVTLGTGANARRAVVTGGKTAVFDALDAATGQFLFALDSGLTNLFTSIDPVSGEKRTNPALEPVAGETLLLCPGNLGARNWPATSLNPSTGILFVPMLESCADYRYSPRSPAQFAAGGTDINFSPQARPGSDGKLGRVVAIDLQERRVLWTHRQPMPLTSSMLATAGGVVFVGDVARNLSAHDQATGALLWRTQLPAAAESTPIAYAAGNRQYIAVVSGEGSHLGTYNRRLVPELPSPINEISLVVYSLP
jgi:alcohol dehydrogenase (cytochrome c)